MSEKQPTLLVIGAGIAGVSAALEAAETGAEVVLVEREPYIGGRVVRNHNYFPKMCPPTCGMEINIKRLERSSRVRVLMSTTVSAAEPTDTGWKVTLTTDPAFVNSKCTACGDCEKVCETEVEDDFNLGMSKVKAIRLAHPHAWPKRFAFDRSSVSDDEAKKILESCGYDAIDLDAVETSEIVEVGAVVVATGWQSYPLANLAEIGGGVYDDVIANVQMERLATPSGPTGGKILRPSNGEPPSRVAFVQCAGSRDVNHLPYCSGVCCLASLKQIQYVKEQLPDAEVTMYYIDRRTPGRNEDVLLTASAIDGVRLVKGKVGKVEQINGSLTLKVEDVEAGKIIEDTADLVVLATGMQPLGDDAVALPITKDEDGFILDDLEGGVFAAGVARRPEDVHSSVRDATGAVARAFATAMRRA